MTRHTFKPKRRIPRYLVAYVPPGRRRATQLVIGPRQLEMLEMLNRQPASRLDMLALGRPRIALNATSTVNRLRQKGIDIHSEWQTATDGDYLPIRYVQYQLKGRVVSTQPQEKQK